MRKRLRVSALGLLAAVGLALAGCSQSPLRPGDLELNGVTPPIASFAADGTVAYVWAPADGSESHATGAPSPRKVSSSSSIDGSRGGTVRVGRFTVRVPAGAFSGTATVTASMQDSTVMICDLAITPASANAFSEKVELVVDLSCPGMTEAADFSIYYYDPAKREWKDIGNSRHSGTEVTAELEHFSTYGAGKAGW